MASCTTNKSHADRPAVVSKCVWRNDDCQCCEECRDMCLKDMADSDNLDRDERISALEADNARLTGQVEALSAAAALGVDEIRKLREAAGQVKSRDSEIERLLVSVRLRFERGLGELRYVPHSDPSGHPHGYSVVQIPDWETRQLVAEIDEVLKPQDREERHG